MTEDQEQTLRNVALHVAERTAMTVGRDILEEAERIYQWLKNGKQGDAERVRPVCPENQAKYG